MSIKNIIFTGDLSRYHEKYPHAQNKWIEAVYHLFSKQIEMATGIKPKYLTTHNTAVFDREKFYSLSKYDLKEENWIKFFCGEYSKESADYFAECFKDCFLIFQEGGVLEKVAIEKNIPYINMYASAIRFLQDIHFAFRTNVDAIRELLKKYKIPENNIFVEANTIKALYSIRNFGKQNIFQENSILFCGQTILDSSLLKNGKTMTVLDYEDKIKEIFSKYDNVYYKPHPYAKNDIDIQFMKSLGNVQDVNSNFYEILSDDNLSAIAALSSGVLTEAHYFGKKSYTISHEHASYYKEEGIIKPLDYITISDEYFSPTFWSDILSPLFDTKKVEYFNFGNKQNFLRSCLNAWWSYTINKPMIPKKRSHTPRFKTLRRFVALFIPSRELRRKIRKGN
ncbi:MAG: hypothetical protein LBG67_03140 [Campylobacteraceae bacterium]|jgi:hypothetical protein|nr:hypothetical protein [Campylobacteraceae bacterium]